MGELIQLGSSAEAAAHGPLWREAVGDVVRSRRQGRGERLIDVAQRAGVSPQYLSEVERGLKDPSSEMLHAIIGAIDEDVAGALREAADRLDPLVIAGRLVLVAA